MDTFIPVNETTARQSEFVPWPSWRYGPGGASDIFQSEAEVPAGWADHPSKVKDVPVPPPPPASSGADDNGSSGQVFTDGVDSAGTPFDPARHTGTKTKAGLWRMKVGVARPESEATPLPPSADTPPAPPAPPVDVPPAPPAPPAA